MGLYPVGLDLSGKPCVVVGGGEVAARKVAALLEAGARVTVVSPELCAGLQRQASDGALSWEARTYREGDLSGCRLAIAATNNPAVNRAVAAEASAQGAWVTVVDQPEQGDMTAPALVRQGDLALAVFTGGHSPMLARRIREELAQQFGPEYGEWLAMLGALRVRLANEIADQAVRREVYHRLVYSDAVHLLCEGRRDQVEAMVEALIKEARRA